jgi:DNA invertase Pin-like site-specific DNA recombinase
MRELLISVFAWLAAQERRRRSEQTKAGLRRAWAKGKKSGRPTIDQDKAEAVRDYLSQKKHSYRESQNWSESGVRPCSASMDQGGARGGHETRHDERMVGP